VFPKEQYVPDSSTRTGSYKIIWMNFGKTLLLNTRAENGRI